MSPRINADALARMRQRRLEMKTFHPSAIDETPPEILRQIEDDEPEITIPPEGVDSFTTVYKTITNVIDITDKGFRTLRKEIAELKQQQNSRKLLAFKGEFQRAIEYQEGDVVTCNDKLYCAVKEIPAGGHLRNGQDGWVLMCKGVV